MIRIVRHAHTAVLAASILAALSLWSRAVAQPSAQVQDLRVGEHPGSTRVVLDISEPTEMTFAVAADGRTVTVTMPNANWHAGSFQSKHAKGTLRDFRHDGNQLTLATHEPVKIKAPFFVSPQGKQGHRVVIDMVADPAVPTKPVAAAAPTPRALAPQPLNEPIASAHQTTAGLEPPADVIIAPRATASSVGYPASESMALSPGGAARPVETAQATPPRAQPVPQQMPAQAPMQRVDNPRGPLGGMMYVKGGFGVSMLEEADASGTGNNATVETSLGWAAVGGIGIDLKNNFRIEGEVFYTSNEAQSVRGTVNSTVTTTGSVSGDVTSLAFMANGAYDFTNAYAITPYIFGGAGLAMVSLNNVAPNNTTGWDDSDWVFALQAGVGAALDITERLSLDFGYRYFETMELELADANGVPFTYENAAHLFLLSLRYKF